MKSFFGVFLSLAISVSAETFGKSLQLGRSSIPRPLTARVAPIEGDFFYFSTSLLQNELGERTGSVPAINFLDSQAEPRGGMSFSPEIDLFLPFLTPSDSDNKSALASYLRGDRLYLGHYRHQSDGELEELIKIYAHSVPIRNSAQQTPDFFFTYPLPNDTFAVLKQYEDRLELIAFDGTGDLLFHRSYRSEAFQGSDTALSSSIFATLTPAPDGIGSYLMISVSEFSLNGQSSVTSEQREICLRLEQDGTVRWTQMASGNGGDLRSLSQTLLPNGDLVFEGSVDGEDQNRQLVLARVTADGEETFVRRFPDVLPSASFAVTGERIYLGAPLPSENFVSPFVIYELSPETGIIIRQRLLSGMEGFNLSRLLGATDDFLWGTIDENTNLQEGTLFQKSLVRMDLDLSEPIRAKRTATNSSNASFDLLPDGSLIFQEMEFFTSRLQVSTLDDQLNVGLENCLALSDRSFEVTTPDFDNAASNSISFSVPTVIVTELGSVEVRDEGGFPLLPFGLNSIPCRPIVTPPVPVELDTITDGNYGISCPSRPGFSYELQSTPNLARDFIPQEDLPGDGTNVRFEVPIGNEPRMFFRIVETR